jgi:translocation and assembly module TamB
MTRRFSRHDAAPRRRWAVFSLAALAVLGVGGWLAPTVLVLTSLRDRPLQAVFAGIDGSIESGSARWNWLAGIEFCDVILHDRAGTAVALVPRVVIDRGLALLAFSPRDLGTIRLVAPEVLVEVRAGGSSLEDILAPWLASFAAAPAAGSPRFDLEIVDGAIELVDRERHNAWRVSEVMAVGTVERDGTLAGWTVAGRVRHAVPTDAAVVPPPPSALPPGSSARLDRTTIAARATAVLAREGGWSVSSPEAADEGTARTVTVATHRLPLGVSSVMATRFAKRHVLDGLADVRLDLQVAAGSARATGTLVLDEAALCAADTLAELVSVARCELPLDLTVERDRVVVRKLAAKSPLFRGEASGTIRLPTGGSWDWAEDLVSEDFAIAADIDLAAVSQGMPGGLAVRPDVRLTGGTLELAAAAHGDGADRVLEARVAARNLAAVQGTAGAEAAERPLRWSEPFTGWVRGRRSSGRGARLTVEDARMTSGACELSAAGTAEAATLQWTLDFDRLVADVNDVLDLEGVELAGTSRGRIDIAGGRRDQPTTVKATASLRDFVWALPGRPAWRDKEVDLELEADGRLAAGAAVVEAAHAVITAADDRLEATLTGGVIVDVISAVAGSVGPWVRPLPDAAGIAADCSLAGDVGRWHARAAGWLPAAGVDLELAGRVEASAAIAARGAAWQITRAGGEIEKLSLTLGGHTIAEPRVVATIAGLVDPALGRVDISSAEVLTATLSLRSGGVSWLPAPAGAAAQGMAAVLDRVRGRVQWQAEVGRLARWMPPAALADSSLTASGRAWGTLEIADVQSGVNLLFEAVGSQLALARGETPREIWSEPRAAVALEVTRPRGAAGDAVMLERVAIESSTLTAAARGSVNEWATRRFVALDGTVNWNWEQLSRLASPWTRGQVRLAGMGNRPFTFRGPLGSLPQAAVAAAASADVVPLPADWLAATRGRDPDAVERQARITRPVTASVRPTDEFADRLRSLAVDTSLAWHAADVAGFAVAAGEMPVRLFEGQLALGPFDVGVAGGRVRGSPWLRLVGTPRELVVPPGRIIERVSIGGPHADAIVKLLSPLLGQRTQTEGVATVDLAGARLPLAAPLTGELAGQVILEQFEVTPHPSAQPLVNLLVKLQSAIDPRFAFGDKAVLLRVRPEPVRIRLADRRFWHEGLVMDAGQLVVKSQGSVGADGTLAMTVEVAFRGDAVGNTPVIAQLVRTPLAIPLKGTVERPQFDARALEMILGRIVENTAQAVISDGLGRGLETLFGNPQPPAAQQPLILPPR